MQDGTVTTKQSAVPIKSSNRNARIAAVLSGGWFPLVLVCLLAVGLVVALVAGHLGGGGTDTLASHPYYPRTTTKDSSTSGSNAKEDARGRGRGADGCLGWDLGRGRWATGPRACDRAVHAVAGCNDYLRPAHHAAHTLRRQRALDPVAKRSIGAWEFVADVRQRCALQRVDRTTLAAALRGKHVAVVGDSVTRFLYAALLRAAAAEPRGWDMHSAVKHRDWEHRLVGRAVHSRAAGC
jgi:hypothetical protein